MGGQFSYSKLEEKYNVNEITFDVLKLTDNTRRKYINPVVTKYCQQHLDICISLQEAQEQYIRKKEINCPCGARVKELTDLRKDIRSVVSQQFHQKTEYVQVIQGILMHKYYRSSEFLDSLKQVNQEMPNFLIEIKNNYINYNGPLKEKLKQQQKYCGLCLKDKVKIIIPVRIKQCKHIECYELTSLLNYRQQLNQKKRKKFFQCAHFNCNVMLNVQTLQYMAIQLMLDNDLINIFNEGQPSQIIFLQKQDEKMVEEIDPAIFQCNNLLLEYQQIIKTNEELNDLEFIIQNEAAEVLQATQDQKYQKQLQSMIMKNQMISFEDNFTGLMIETPVRCKECYDLKSFLDIKSYAAFVFLNKNEESKFECPLCHYEWDLDTVKFVNIIHVDQILLQVLLHFDFTKQKNYNLDGRNLLFNQIKTQYNLSRKSFLKELQKTEKSTIANIPIFPQIKLPLVKKNCPFQNLIDFDVFYDSLLNDSQNQGEFFQNYVNNLQNIQFHQAYQDIIQIAKRINFNECQCLYDFRKRYIILQGKKSVEVLMFNNGEISVFSYYSDNENETFKFQMENLKAKNIIIELFKINGQVITEDLENCKDFKFYVCESIYLYFLKEKIIFKLNQSQEERQPLEQKSLSQISDYFNEILIIYQCLQENQIHCLILYNQIADALNFVLKNIQDSITNKVEKIDTNVELIELLEGSFCDSNEQFQNKFNVKVRQAFACLIFGTKEKLNEISNLITYVSSRKKQKLKKKIIELENEMLKQEIELKIQRNTNESLFKCPQLMIKYINEEKIKMIIIAEESKIVKTFQTIQSMIYEVNQQIFAIHCQLTQKQQRKLELKAQNEIQKIQRLFFCQIQFSQSYKSEEYLELKYMKKSLYFLRHSMFKLLNLPHNIWNIPCILVNKDDICFRLFDNDACDEFCYYCGEYSQKKMDQELSYLNNYFFCSQNQQNIAIDFRDWNSSHYKFQKAKKEIVEFIVNFFYKYKHYTQNVFFIENYFEDIKKSKLIVKEFIDKKDVVLLDPQNNQRESFQIIEHSQDCFLQKKQVPKYQSELNILSHSNQNIRQAIIELEKCLGVIEVTIKYPQLFNAENQLFSSIISQYQIKSSTQQIITFKIYKSQQEDLSKDTNCFFYHQNQYPQNWAIQYSNFYKISLNKTDSEYRMVEQHFKKTENGNIYRIYRIQNKQLWENYIFDKNKLIKSYQNKGQTLTNLEKERYLWHGVRGQHPEIIYKGDKEGFDSTYASLDGSYGGGIYFSEKANYSRSFSFVLNGNQDSDLKGSRVFLYCLVTTGKLQTIGSNSSIRRPNQGYDCITDGGDMFILYTMDARRAYPAYEVIFQ